MKSIFKVKGAFYLHEWVRMDSTPLVFTTIGARYMWVCKKCGKTTFYPNY